jgi:hypothetical protein
MTAHIPAPSPVRIPLHLSPDDHRREADQRRYDLANFMISLNPKGFRPNSPRLRRLAKRGFNLED